MVTRKSIECCRNKAKNKRLKNLKKLEIAVKEWDLEKELLGLETLAKASNVSLSWLYNHPELKHKINKKCLTREKIRFLTLWIEWEKILLDESQKFLKD